MDHIGRFSGQKYRLSFQKDDDQIVIDIDVWVPENQQWYGVAESLDSIKEVMNRINRRENMLENGDTVMV